MTREGKAGRAKRRLTDVNSIHHHPRQLASAGNLPESRGGFSVATPPGTVPVRNILLVAHSRPSLGHHWRTSSISRQDRERQKGEEKVHRYGPGSTANLGDDDVPARSPPCRRFFFTQALPDSRSQVALCDDGSSGRMSRR